MEAVEDRVPTASMRSCKGMISTKAAACFATMPARLGLRIFVPPLGPPHLMRGPGDFSDDPLFVRAEWPGQASQCGFDKPRFQDYPGRFSVRIECLGHSQRLECSGDASRSHPFPDNVQGTDGSLPICEGFLNYRERRAGGSAVTFHAAFRELEQKRAGTRALVANSIILRRCVKRRRVDTTMRPSARPSTADLKAPSKSSGRRTGSGCNCTARVAATRCVLRYSGSA